MDFVVLNKPFGLLTHPKNSSSEWTLQDFLIENFELEGYVENDRKGIVHRLDRVTSGLILCPLNNDTHYEFEKKFKEREIFKKYRAVVEGVIFPKKAELELPLRHSIKNRKKREVHHEGRRAITEYELITNNQQFSLLDINLVTGRNHQIRAHFEYIKYPIVNDELYGGKRNSKVPSSAICLQAYKLTFNYKNENYSFEINIPEYFTSIINI
ncbi:MAG: RNA pseudouridine synthase [Actinomycetota bacterium]|nr:RNA pseudouridine synthase [Actinomycetota bacterium]MDA3012970.1 RNA pseudouridine synthase [Actinomycetota bacterium]